MRVRQLQIREEVKEGISCGICLKYSERHVWLHDQMLPGLYELQGRRQCTGEEMRRKNKNGFSRDASDVHGRHKFQLEDAGGREDRLLKRTGELNRNEESQQG